MDSSITTTNIIPDFDFEKFAVDMENTAILTKSKGEPEDSVINNTMGMVMQYMSLQVDHTLTREEFEKYYYHMLNFFNKEETDFLFILLRGVVDPDLVNETREAYFYSGYQSYAFTMELLFRNKQSKLGTESH